MIDSKITRQCFIDGKIKKCDVIIGLVNGTMHFMTCRFMKYRIVDGDFLVKLKTPKEYPLGHKYLWRHIDEL